MNDVTMILDAIGQDEDAIEKLLPLVYAELRTIAAAKMARESAGHTLQPTALVHEAWLRLVGDEERSWKNRAYFFAAAAEAMRRILVDHARKKARLKHGAGRERLNIADIDVIDVKPDERILLIDEALKELEIQHPEQARVVVMKYFGAMKNREVADLLGICERTVDRHWLYARTWLFEKIREKESA